MAFTVHGMDPELEVKLTQRAKREGISRNQLVKQLLARAMGYSDMNPEDDDYREFLGCWTQEEKDAFDKVQLENQRIDDEDWQ